MLNILKYIFCFLVLFYVGEDGGQMISGIQGEVPINDFMIAAEVRSYIGKVNARSFSPDKVVYKVGLGYKNFRVYQECSHGVDKGLKNPYITNYVQVNL